MNATTSDVDVFLDALTPEARHAVTHPGPLGTTKRIAGLVDQCLAKRWTVEQLGAECSRDLGTLVNIGAGITERLVAAEHRGGPSVPATGRRDPRPDSARHAFTPDGDDRYALCETCVMPRANWRHGPRDTA